MKSISVDINSVRGNTCGLFVSPGYGRHTIRTRHDWEIIFVRSGTLHMFVGDIKYEVKAGQALIIKAGQLHGGYRDYDGELSFYWFHFYAELSKNGETNITALSTPSRPDRLVDLLESYLLDIYAKRQNQSAKDCIARLILFELSDFSNKNTDGFNPLAAKIQTYIHENISGSISASSIAKALGLSSDYIERVYKKAYKETITSGIQKARVFYACELLRYSTLSVSEIAIHSGFTRVNDFCRVFKRVKAVTPSEYRKQHSHDIINNI